MIVGRDIDLQAVERESRAYNGLYFVLGGSVPIFDRHPSKNSTKELRHDTKMTSQDEGHKLKEVIHLQQVKS